MAFHYKFASIAISLASSSQSSRSARLNMLMHITKLFGDQPSSKFQGVQSYLVFSSVDVELRLRSNPKAYRPGRYHETLHRLLAREEKARDEALIAAKAGDHAKCIQIVGELQSPLLRVFATRDEAVNHVNSELRKLEDTRFNDLYSETCFGAVVHVGIYVEAS